jgi:hypothetical protein
MNNFGLKTWSKKTTIKAVYTVQPLVLFTIFKTYGKKNVKSTANNVTRGYMSRDYALLTINRQNQWSMLDLIICACIDWVARLESVTK